MFGEINISSELLAALLNKQQINKDNTITLERRPTGKSAVGSKRFSWRAEENHELKVISTRYSGYNLQFVARESPNLPNASQVVRSKSRRARFSNDWLIWAPIMYGTLHLWQQFWRRGEFCMKLTWYLNDIAFNIIPYEKQIINEIDLRQVRKKRETEFIRRQLWMMGTKGEVLMDKAKAKIVALQIKILFSFVLYNVITYVKRLMLCTLSGHKFEYR